MACTPESLPLPRHLDKNLQEVGRLHPARVTLEMQMTGLSTARMELTEEDGEVCPGEFAELFWMQGSAGIFRVTEVETVFGIPGSRRVHLEHAMITLADRLVFGYAEVGGRGMDMASVIRWLLDGQEMPLPTDGWTASGLPEYEAAAIVIALNQAYVNSLAGLQ